MFHDDYLTEISIADKQHEVRLGIRTQTGTCFVHLRGVERFLANNVCEGNIIPEVEYGAGPNWADRIETNAVAGFAALIGEPKGSPYLCKCAARVRKGELHCFVLLSSYGADVYALCADVQVVDAVE